MLCSYCHHLSSHCINIVETDWYPDELSWILKKKNCQTEVFEEIASLPSNQYQLYTRRNKVYTTTICSEQSIFQFEMKDSYGDGNDGIIFIKMGSTVVVNENGYYGYSKTFTFGECIPAPTGPPPACLKGSAFWKIDEKVLLTAGDIKLDIHQMVLAEFKYDLEKLPKRRFAQNAVYDIEIQHVPWAAEQMQIVKKAMAVFTFETCQLGDMDECPKWMVSSYFVLCIST